MLHHRLGPPTFACVTILQDSCTSRSNNACFITEHLVARPARGHRLPHLSQTTCTLSLKALSATALLKAQL